MHYVIIITQARSRHVSWRNASEVFVFAMMCFNAALLVP
jgi:hypothetical protein